MSDKNTAKHELTFRNFRDESDYPLLLEINLSNRRANNNNESVKLEDIVNVLSNHMDGVTVTQKPHCKDAFHCTPHVGRICGLQNQDLLRIRA